MRGITFMNQNDQALALLNELQKTINRFRSEYEINYPIVIGCLEMTKQRMWEESQEESQEELTD